MEKAILKTLIYADIFDFSLTIFEIHKWLIGKRANLRQVEKAIKRLNQESRIKNQGGYFTLKNRKGLAKKRLEGQKQAQIYLRKIKIISQILKIIPWVKLVGISGGLAMENAGKKDDIDLFVVTSKDRIWISRLLILGILSLTGQRRRVLDKKVMAAGKICCNLILEEDYLEQKKKNIYTAHEVLQMKMLWQRGGIYSRYLLENEWVFKFLPNWVGGDFSWQPRSLAHQRKRSAAYRLGYARPPVGGLRLGFTTFGSRLLSSLDYVERQAKKIQLSIMGKPKGQERIEEGVLYFHPQNYQNQVLKEYNLRIKNISTP